MLETSARLLRLLSLFQGRRYWAGHDLAERLEVTSRTLRRDVDKLRALGYPIHSTSGVEGGYQLGAGAEMPPLLLDDEEAVAVALGLRSGATGAIAGIEEASLRALSKMEQLLPPRLARRVSALQAMIVTRTGSGSEVDARVLSILASACRDQESLRFRYQDYAGKATARSVEPHRVVNTGRRWYLVAWDADRQDWRTFRVDRIQGRPATGPRCVPREPPAKDLAAYVAKGAWFAPPCRARLRLLVAASAASQLWICSVGMIEPIDDASCYFDVGSPTFANLAIHLTMLGVDFEVVEPVELIAEVQLVIARLERAVAARG